MVPADTQDEAISDRADDLPATFSRGLKQKAAIAIAFVFGLQLRWGAGDPLAPLYAMGSLVPDEVRAGVDTPCRTTGQQLLDLHWNPQAHAQVFLIRARTRPSPSRQALLGSGRPDS